MEYRLNEYTFEQVFSRQRAGYESEYWWAFTPDHDGYVVVWLDRDGKEKEHLHTYHYPPDVWGE